MRRRTAMMGIFFLMLSFAGNIIMGVEAAMYTALLIEKAELHMEDSYQNTVAPEEVLSAPCATYARGIFSNTSIRSGNFDCITPRGILYLRFDWGDAQQTWRIERSGGTVAIQETISPILQHNYDITVCDRKQGTCVDGELRVGVT